MTTPEQQSPDLADLRRQVAEQVELKNKLKEIEAQIEAAEQSAEEQSQVSPGDCPDCDLPKADHPVTKALVDAFYSAMELCFDELPDEPRKILIVGGCRQRDMARRLAFMLPFCAIHVLDPDYDQYKKAQEEIRCRFKFVHSPVEETLFEDGYFDLTLSHSLFEYTEDGEAALRELARVTKHNLLVGAFRPAAWNLLGWLPGMKQTLKVLGCGIPKNQPSAGALKKWLKDHAEIRLTASPFPWTLRMCRLKASRP